MAFDPEHFALVLGDMTGEVIRLFAYRTTDTSGTVFGTGYFTGVAEYGGRVADHVIVIFSDTGRTATGRISSVDASGNGSIVVDTDRQVQVYATRPELVEIFSGGQTFEVGTLFQTADGTLYAYDGTSTEILDMPGTVPVGVYTPQHFGSTGTSKERVDGLIYGWTLADRFTTLVAAQAVYPKATSLTQTLDDHASQRMIDVQRDEFILSSGVVGTLRHNTRQMGGHWPPGTYVYTRTLDATDIYPPAASWRLTSDQAVIINQCVGHPWLDLLGTSRAIVEGFNIINDLVPYVGCPRSSILMGRPESGISSGENVLRNLDVTGFCSLAVHHNYASEVNSVVDCEFVNHLDPRQVLMTVGNLSGTPVAGEAVTWAGSGAGTVIQYVDPYIYIQVTSGTITASTAITTAGGATFTAVSPWALPSGEGKDGRSFGVVLDAENYWGTNSQYAPNRAQSGSVASFLMSHYTGTVIHSGRGDAFWIGGGIRWVDLRGCYRAVTGDDDESATITCYAGINGQFRNIYIDGHGESDGGDTDDTTGVTYLVRFDAENSSQQITCYDWDHRIMTMNAAVSTYYAESNVIYVLMRNHYFSIGTLGAGDSPDNRRCWLDASKFSVDGWVSYSDESSSQTYLNLSSLNNFSGVARVPNLANSNYHRTVNSGYLLVDSGLTAFMNSVRIQAGDQGVCRVVGYNSGTILGKVEIHADDDPDPGFITFTPDADDDNDLVLTPAAVYWGGDTGTQNLGLEAKRFGVVWAEDLELRPGAVRTPEENGDLTIAATNNTTLTFSFKGSDGTVRSGTVTLS